MKFQLAMLAVIAVTHFGCHKSDSQASSPRTTDPIEQVGSLVGHDACSKEMGAVYSSPSLKAQITKLFGKEQWDEWAAYSTNCDPIPGLKDEKGRQLVEIQRRNPAYAPTNAVILLSGQGNVLYACFSENTNSSVWKSASMTFTTAEEGCNSDMSLPALVQFIGAKVHPPTAQNHPVGCDTDVVLNAVRGLLIGQTNSQASSTTWLRNAVQITVLNERRDDTGRHFTCDANLNVPLSAIRESTDSIARASILMGKSPSSLGIQYVLSIDPDRTNFTVVLTPASEDEGNAIRILGDAVKAIQPDASPQNNADGNDDNQR